MKKLNKKSILFLLVLFLGAYVKVIAQGVGSSKSASVIQLPTITPASPEAAALGKYGDQKVGLNTGTVSANIPLYELASKNIKLSIGLSYSSNGIRVDDLSSRAGMGWVLNAGGVITRTVYDKPDFEHPRLSAPPNTNFAGIVPTKSDGSDANLALLGWLENNTQTYNNLVDNQIDEFTYNFNGYSGKFILDNNQIPILLPQSDLKIEYNSNGILWNFKITTPDGNKYYFGGQAASDVTMATGGSLDHDQYTSAWYLNKIESIKDPAENITLTYNQNISYEQNSGVSQTITTLSETNTYFNPSSENTCPNTSLISGLNQVNYKLSFTRILGVTLQSITSSKYGSIMFTYQNKPDVSTGQDFLIQQIEIDAPSGTPIKYFKFDYDFVSPNNYANGSNPYYINDFDLQTNLRLPRPFLKDVIELPNLNSNTGKKYSFTYINKENLPQRLSFCQDHWGYYNGANAGLTSLISPATAPNYADLFDKTRVLDFSTTLVNQTDYSILNSNRDVDYNYAQNGLLNQITYPTGGYTQFTYEGNSKNGVNPDPKKLSVDFKKIMLEQTTTTVSTSNVSASNSQSIPFTVNQATNVKLTMLISCNCPNGGCNKVQNSTIAGNLITDAGTSVANFDYSLFNTRGDCSKYSFNNMTLQPGNYTLNVIPNGNYQLSLTLDCTDNNKISVPYIYVPNSPKIPYFLYLDGSYYGGMRVKTKIDYDPVNGTTEKTNYLYSGMVGSYLPQYQAIFTNYGVGHLWYKGIGETVCYNSEPIPLSYTSYVQYFANSSINLVGYYSHNVSYQNVTEQFGDNYQNGGIDHVYSYDRAVVTGSIYFHKAIPTVLPPIYTWRNGLELSNLTYKMVNNQKVSIKSTMNTYLIDPRISNSFEQFVIKKNGNSDIYNTPYGYSKRSTIFDVESIIQKQEWQYLSQSQTTNYDGNGQNPVTTTENYYYDNPTHLQLTRKVSTNSDGKILTSLITYPDDYTAGTTFLDNMRANHLTGIPIESVNYETVNSANTILSGKITQYLSGGQGLVDKVFLIESTVPITQTGFKFSNSTSGTLPISGTIGTYGLDSHYVPRLIYNGYNTSGDPLSVSLANGPSVSYQWGYNNQYPVAKASNATSNDIFFDSFEEGSGNSSTAKTGHFGYNGTYNKSLTGLDAGSYTLTYWQQVNGTWTFVNTPVAVTGTNYTINLSGQIDDVRFYPAAAQMTTYTYDPLIGETSVTDPKGEVTFYEYDAFQRLTNIKDKDGNIIKHIDYHYQGQ